MTDPSFIFEMMTFTEQLETWPQIKELLTTKPPAPRAPSTAPEWRVYAQPEPEGGWAKKDFDTYVGAFKFWKERRRDWHDGSISSRRRTFDPPGRVVKLAKHGQPVMVRLPNGKSRQKTRLVPIKPPAGHSWCLYCRRFTVFRYFRKHHNPAFDGLAIDPTVKRCAVCGISEATGAFR